MVCERGLDPDVDQGRFSKIVLRMTIEEVKQLEAKQIKLIKTKPDKKRFQ